MDAARTAAGQWSGFLLVPVGLGMAWLAKQVRLGRARGAAAGPRRAQARGLPSASPRERAPAASRARPAPPPADPADPAACLRSPTPGCTRALVSWPAWSRRWSSSISP
jgi:hypothetical protein